MAEIAAPSGLDPVGALARAAQAASAARAARAAADKDPRLARQARDFESMFLETTLSQLTSGLKGEGPMGASDNAQETWRGMLTQQYARTITNAGGVGIADSVYRELVRMQAQAGATGGPNAA